MVTSLPLTPLRPPFAYPRLPKTSDRKKDVSFAGYNGTVMSFNFVICSQFAFLIKKNVDWVIFTVFFLIKMYSTVFQNKQHNCAWHAKMVTSSRDATYTYTTCDCSQILQRPEMHRHSQGHRLWSWTWSEKNLVLWRVISIGRCLYLRINNVWRFPNSSVPLEDFQPFIWGQCCESIIFIRFRSESQIIAGPNLY